MLATILLKLGDNLYVLFALALFVLVAVLNRPRKFPVNLPILSPSGESGPSGARKDIQAFVRNGFQVVQQGYDQYSKKGQNFFMRTPDGLVFVAAPRFIEELRQAPDDKLSAMAASNDVLQVQYTLHPELAHTWYEFDTIRTDLTRSLAPTLPDVVDQCHRGYVSLLGQPSDWTSKHMWPICCRIVTQVTNRLLFGEEMANHPAFTELAANYTYTVFGGAHTIRYYPSWTRSFIMWWKTRMGEEKALAKKLLGPLLISRIKRIKEARRTNGESERGQKRPNDAVQWVLELTPPHHLDDIDLLVARMLHLVVSAIHTSSSTFMDTMYDLALHPEVVAPLREEIDRVMAAEGGWTKQGLTKMHKLDSLIKESSRWHPFITGALDRRAIQDLRLSDGSVIPKGCQVTVPHLPMLFDEDLYGPTANEFDPFRFSKRKETPGEENKHLFVQTSSDYMFFGYVHT
ncbi:hypothetical protein ASPWEDRAFT_29710 [Aspergillus wentii DTO 134E9]|uniref:Cytochrome P450 n=1 Tax=Aspergillus wentii DTO 134E9 TaxID=1073089 RepID=A0A1L9RI27_ASPWE|nr:uncharacterized protein ASPWEDRAFT_29710 [Aspergillus wentii DTO 134E9]OJJ34582.1 hypothetical protein ASPWEDRAFT_29710 [Aspergillus wentii DTO 134E9]